MSLWQGRGNVKILCHPHLGIHLKEKSKETTLDDNIHAKPEKLSQPKADLNDDREIDIVFDKKSGSDDKHPFPQPDDSFQSPPIIVGQNWSCC
jgi:hypothetical protein